MRRAFMWLNLYGREAVQHKLTDRLKTQKMHFFACFWAYVGQPHSHIGEATSMPFTSFNPTNPRTNPWNFHKKIFRIGDFEKRTFFESAIFNFNFQKKYFFFASFPLKSVKSSWITSIGRNFYDYRGLHPKITPPKHFSWECTNAMFPYLWYWSKLDYLLFWTARIFASQIAMLLVWTIRLDVKVAMPLRLQDCKLIVW